MSWANRRKVFVWHVIIVVVSMLAVLLIDVLTPDDEGVIFLAAVPVLVVLVLGAPWSIISGVFLVNGYGGEYGGYAGVALIFGPALANLAIHALLLRRKNAITRSEQ